MNQSEANDYTDQEGVDEDDFSVLTADEFSSLRALSATPGLGYLALFREGKREYVSAKCGLSPKIAELRELWRDSWDGAWEWLSESALVHANVYEVCSDEVAGSAASFVGFAISPKATGLGARLVWKVLVGESPQWDKFSQMRVGEPELARGGFSVVEESASPASVSETTAVSWPAAVLAHADDVMRRNDLDLAQFVVVDGVASECGVDEPGCCYLQLFNRASRPHVFRALGKWPLVGRVFELYSAAAVRGFSSDVGLQVTGDGDRRHLVPADGDWRDNLMRLTALASVHVDARLGGLDAQGGDSSGAEDGTSVLLLYDCSDTEAVSKSRAVSVRSQDEVLVLQLLARAEGPVCLLPVQDSSTVERSYDSKESIQRLETGREYFTYFAFSTILIIPKGVRVGFPRFTLDCSDGVGLVRVVREVTYTVWSAPPGVDVMRTCLVTPAVQRAWDLEFGKLSSASYVSAVSWNSFASVLILRAGGRCTKTRSKERWYGGDAVQVHDELCADRGRDVWRVPDVRDVEVWPKGGRRLVSVEAVGRQRGFKKERSEFVDHSRVTDVMRIGNVFHEVMVDGLWPVVNGSGWPFDCIVLERVSMTVAWARERGDGAYPPHTLQQHSLEHCGMRWKQG